MRKVKEEHYPDYIEFAETNPCNTIYPMAISEGVQHGDIYTDDMENPQYALLHGSKMIGRSFFGSMFP